MSTAQQNDYIELNRTFHKISNKQSDLKYLDANMTSIFGKSCDWGNIINDNVVIILAPAGAGKTTEIRQQAIKVRNQSKCAFFMRLENIYEDFEDAFEINSGSHKEFQDWLQSSDEGWLFLDSVDESRLKDPKDFQRAIRSIAKKVSSAKNRTHFCITSRITAWRPKSDYKLCDDFLHHRNQERKTGLNENDQSETHEKNNNEELTIVALDKLTVEQQSKLLQHIGINNTHEFLTKVEQSNAQEFTTRPQDLIDLAVYWQEKGRLGSYREIIEYNVKRLLKERNQDRLESYSVPYDKLYRGAKLLAATLTLTQRSDIIIPDGLNSNGVNVHSILTKDWDTKDHKSLLEKPIFDESIYGAVRFHHRTIREYLTAKWFEDLLSKDTSHQNIESMFFKNQYGIRIINPLFKPILPWLLSDDSIRNNVCKIEPELLLNGGDPSYLPFELRNNILHKICKQIGAHTTSEYGYDCNTVRYFIKPDLGNDICNLLNNPNTGDKVLCFLMDMVRFGELKSGLPYAMEIAKDTHKDKYLRSRAIHVVNSIGTNSDQELIRQSFMNEQSEHSLFLFNELISGITVPTEDDADWFLCCAESCQKIKESSFYSIFKTSNKFIKSFEIRILVHLIPKLRQLLDRNIRLDIHQYKWSEQLEWFLETTETIMLRLIENRNKILLDEDSLQILRILEHSRYSSKYEIYRDEKIDLSAFVPKWTELNKSLFWFDVGKLRDENSKKQYNDYYSIMFGVANNFWNFSIDDFDYAIRKMKKKKLIDNKLIMLHLAFRLYLQSDKPKDMLDKIEKTIKDNKSLKNQLEILFIQNKKNIKKEQLQNTRMEKLHQKTEEHKRQDQDGLNKWKDFFAKKLDEIRITQLKEPGTIRDPLYHLHIRLRQISKDSSHYINYNWKCLEKEYSSDVAVFYRDASVAVWRNNIPKLCSDGAPHNSTPLIVIIGMNGIDIEYRENKNWLAYLSTIEAELVCRYALFELNGFPSWLPDVFNKYPDVVSVLLLKEIRYQLKKDIQDKTGYDIIGPLLYGGEWCRDRLAPEIYNYLKQEPSNISTLEKMLAIVQKSNISDDLIRKLAQRKSKTLKRHNHLACWLAVWCGVDPDNAIIFLKARIEGINDNDLQTKFAMLFVTYLCPRYAHEKSVVRESFEIPKHLKTLYLLMRKYIRVEDDSCKDSGWVDLRLSAEDAINSLYDKLKSIKGKAAFQAIADIAAEHPDRWWIKQAIKSKAEQDCKVKPWTIEKVLEFERYIEIIPTNHKELFDLGIARLLDFKENTEDGNNSVAKTLLKITDESEMRNFIARELDRTAINRYSVHQEEENADGKKPDLRFQGKKFEGQVPVELKIADKNWTGPKLCERLENQLCRDYLRDTRSKNGIFLLICRTKGKKWKLPNIKLHVEFDELIVELQNYWNNTLSPSFTDIDDIKVIGIDLTKRKRVVDK